MVSRRGKGCSARRMGGRCSRGGNHRNTALSGSRGQRLDARQLREQWLEARRRLEQLGRSHRQGEGRRNGDGGGFGASGLETGCEIKRKERKGVLYREGGGGGGGGGGNLKGFCQLMALNAN